MSKSPLSLRALLKRDEPVLAPGAYDGLSARLVEQAGFSAIYASGGAIARSTGVPDIGLLSFSDIADRLAQMADVTSVPIIADADTGFGNTLNVRRTIQVFERLGLAGCHIEDQQSPKRCGHLDNKRLVSQDEMVQKIRAAVKARCDEAFVIIARTDAIAVEGFDAAITRAKAYAKAGADMIFVEAPQTVEQIEQIAKAIQTPKLINMFYGGKTPLVELQTLKTLGYDVVIIPSDLQRAAIKAMQNALSVIKTEGDSKTIATQLATFNEREKIVDTAAYFDFDKTC